MASTTKYFTADPQPNLDAVGPSANTSYTLAYRTVGSPDKSAILMPTCYGGKLDSTLTFLWSDANGNTPILDDYLVILVGLLGGSESSSPSNAHESMRGLRFPKPSYEDNIRLQHALCQALGVTRLAAYIGFSMGGQLAYHMAILYPDFAERVIPISTSARTSWHNWSFLEGPKAALINSVDWHDGKYTEHPSKGAGAFGRVYATWALCQEWFRQKCWEKVGFTTLEDYLRNVEKNGLGAWDPHNLLCMLQTWQRGDISLYGPEPGNLPKALETIKAKMLVMPSRTDMYFPPEDSVEEVKHLPHGELCVIESIWGHIGGGGGGPKEDNEFIKDNVKRWLAC